MRCATKAVWVIGLLLLAASGVMAQAGSKSQDAMVIVYKDGHQQSIPMSSVARIEFKSGTAGAPSGTTATPSANDAAVSVNHFVGKWQVGEGVGRSTFFITLEKDGSAKKSIGASHGTWTVVENEARITWDDGWHDAIRKVGTKHEKFAYGPGKSFSDTPDNVTDARLAQPKPI